MFIGHFAVGLGAKRFAPRTSLGWLLAAPLFLDLIWPVFVLGGVEAVRIDPGNTAFTPLEFVSYPWSHSLLMTLVWAVLLAALYHWKTRYRPGTIPGHPMNDNPPARAARAILEKTSPCVCH